MWRSKAVTGSMGRRNEEDYEENKDGHGQEEVTMKRLMSSNCCVCGYQTMMMDGCCTTVPMICCEPKRMHKATHRKTAKK